MPTLTRRFIESALAAQRVWDFSNSILYKLCTDFPDHTKRDVIISKTITIGRVYAAQLERRREKGQVSSDALYIEVAQAFRNSGLDKWLAKLDEGSVTDRREAIRTHKRLTDFLQPLTGMNNRSFASKYLHFHRPSLFFIYDTRARASVAALVKREWRRNARANMVSVDAEYADFYLRCETLTDRMSELLKRTPCPREVDKVLLHWHEKNIA
jgi:hypothetical protein